MNFITNLTGVNFNNKPLPSHSNTLLIIGYGFTSPDYYDYY